MKQWVLIIFGRKIYKKQTQLQLDSLIFDNCPISVGKEPLNLLSCIFNDVKSGRPWSSRGRNPTNPLDAELILIFQEYKKNEKLKAMRNLDNSLAIKM